MANSTNMNYDLPQVYAAKLRVVIATINANHPAMLVGQPGVGKSDVIDALFKPDGYHMETIYLGDYDPAEVNGIPYVDPTSGKMKRSVPDWYEEASEHEKVILFADEYSQATQATQGAFNGVLRTRRVGRNRMHDGFRLMAAMNPPDCSAGGVDLTPPTANRMLHIEWLGVDPETWARGLVSGWASITPTPQELTTVVPDSDTKIVARSLVAAYVKANPQQIHDLPDDPESAGGPWGSRRAWEMLADVLAWIEPTDYTAVTIAAEGLVGKAFGTAFATWYRHADLPNPRDILNDPTSYDWSDSRLDRTFVVLAAIVGLAHVDGSKESHTAVWRCLQLCAEVGKGDVAVPHVMAHQRNAKHGWLPDLNAITTYLPMLRDAGLIPTTGLAA